MNVELEQARKRAEELRVVIERNNRSFTLLFPIPIQ